MLNHLHNAGSDDGSSTFSSENARQDLKVGPLDGIKVLVVDDSVSSARLQGFLLHEAGAQVRVVHSAEQAQAAILSFQPRLVVLDWVLPDMSGLELAAQLCALPLGQRMPVVMVTSLNGHETERRVLQVGCAGYLRKPIDVETFAESIAQFLAPKP